MVRILKLFVIYTFIIIYSVELLLFFSLPKEQKKMVNIKEEKIRIAKEQNLKYDLRTPKEFYIDQKKINKNLAPNFLYSRHFVDLNIFKESRLNNKIIPFRGPINKKSISCAEDLNYRIISNDKYGFKNSNSVYRKEINTILVGDSYAEGLCVKAKNDIAGNLNKKNINTINFGVAGTGPLVSLAILREYGNYFKPKNVFYLYFEGNDLIDLNFEKKIKNLLNYRDDNFKMHYLDRYSEIKTFLKKANKESEDLIFKLEKDKDNLKKDEKFQSFKNFSGHLKDILEINNIRNILRFSIFKQQNNTFDLPLFYEIVEKMKLETNNWNGNYYFVYVPSWSRYFTKFTNIDSSINLKDEILEILNSKKIKTIDLTEYFDKTDNLKNYFPLGYFGHYNSSGYERIAEILYNKLK